MKFNHRILVTCAFCVLFVGCENKSATGGKTATSATKAASSSQSGETASSTSKTDGTAKKGKVAGSTTSKPTSPAKADAEALKVLDFPTLKKMVVESKAKLTMVPVWATWCVPCIKEMPHLAEFYEKEHKNGLEIIGLCVGDKTDEDDAESMSEKIAELKSPFHHYILPDDAAETFFKAFGKSYGGTLPSTLVLDQKGEVVVFTRNGWTDKSLNEIIVPKLQ